LLEHARREAESGETFLEFRLDYLSSPCEGAAAIPQFLAQYPDCTLLATCRRHQNHGKFNGSIEEQLAVLDLAVRNGAHAIDIEIETAEVAQDRLGQLRGRTYLIVSYHNFEATPPMDTVVNRVMKVQADAYKIVTTARKPSDNVRVLSAAKALPKHRLIVLAMGELGFPTRVLSPVFGGVYTYAAPMYAEGTAAGQVSSRFLRHLYRVEKLGKSAKIYGVIADPVRHSISPAVHNRAFQSKRLDAVYLPFLVSPACLRDFFSLASKLPLSGFSVTIPHKQKIIRYLDVVEPLARRIGAVNTVWRKAGKWRGTNTDAAGVTGPLSRLLKISQANVLIVGNGGAARSAACALSDAGARIFLVGRNADRRSASQGTARWPPFRRRGPRHAARHVPTRQRVLLRGEDPRRHRFRHGVQPARNRARQARQGAGQNRRPRPGHVHRTGRAPVRNLDRRNRAALRHAEGRAGGAVGERQRRSAIQVKT
jgi:3-dehydroquinate dehydratase/shikimate dehydrogenase